MLLSWPDQSQHSRLHSVEVQEFLGCAIHRSQRQWLPWDNGEKVRFEEYKREQTTSSNGFNAFLLSAVRLDSCWKAPGSVQVSSLKDSTNANSLWKWLCLSQQSVSQSICRSLSLTQGSYRFSFLISAWASPEPLWEDCDSPSELLPWEYTSFMLNSAALKCWHCLWHQRLWFC